MPDNPERAVFCLPVAWAFFGEDRQRTAVCVDFIRVTVAEVLFFQPIFGIGFFNHSGTFLKNQGKGLLKRQFQSLLEFWRYLLLQHSIQSRLLFLLPFV